MPTVVPVKFEYAARDLWFDPKESGVLEGDHVICQTERGLEIGLAVADLVRFLRRSLSTRQTKPSSKTLFV